MSFFDENRTGWFLFPPDLLSPLYSDPYFFPLGWPHQHAADWGQPGTAPKCSWLETTTENSLGYFPPWGRDRIAQRPGDVPWPPISLTSSSPGADLFISSHPQNTSFPPPVPPAVPTAWLLCSSAPGTGNLRCVKFSGHACGFPCLSLCPVPVCATLVWSQSAVTFPTSNFFSVIFLVLRLLPYLAIAARCPGS